MELNNDIGGYFIFGVGLVLVVAGSAAATWIWRKVRRIGDYDNR